MKALFILLIVALLDACSMQAKAASFDCTKASSRVEQRICADSELSALDEQLSYEYKAALRSAANPLELRQSQREWIQKRRDGCGGPGRNDATIDYCLKPIYRRRITELRSWKTSLDQVLGVYTKKTPNCFVYSEKCEGFNEDRIAVSRYEDGAIAIEMQLFFFNGHICTFEGFAEWRQGILAVQDDYKEDPCTFELHSDGHRIFTSYVREACSRYCGARGSLKEVEASK